MYVSTQLGCCGQCKPQPRLSYMGRRPRLRLSGGVGINTAGGIATAASGPAAPIVGAVVGVFDLISSIFGAHAAAVAREANTLNAAVPVFYQAMQAIFAALGQGQITAAQASQAISGAVSTYYSQVGAIIKKQGPCPLNPDCSAPGGNQAGNTSLNPCNGPCSLGCNFIEPAACQAQALLQTGGTVTLYTPTGNSNGFIGLTPVTISYVLPPPANTQLPLPASVASAIAPVLTPVENAIAAAGLPDWVLPVAGGLLAARLLGVI